MTTISIKKFILILTLFVCTCLLAIFVNGCAKDMSQPIVRGEKESRQQQVASYQNITLTCGCTLRVRSDFACCQDKFPEIAEQMQIVYTEAMKLADEMVAIDALDPNGEYEAVPMAGCGCALIVYKPDSCECFEAKHYPELVGALNEVYRLVKENAAEEEETDWPLLEK
jgi:hypothetical protein